MATTLFYIMAAITVGAFIVYLRILWGCAKYAENSSLSGFIVGSIATWFPILLAVITFFLGDTAEIL